MIHVQPNRLLTKLHVWWAATPSAHTLNAKIRYAVAKHLWWIIPVSLLVDAIIFLGI